MKAQYTADLRDAGADCRDTVAATAKRKADYQTQFDEASKPAWKKALPKVKLPFGKKD